MTPGEAKRMAACQTDPRWAAEMYGHVLVPRAVSDAALFAGMAALGDMQFFGHTLADFRRAWETTLAAIEAGK